MARSRSHGSLVAGPGPAASPPAPGLCFVINDSQCWVCGVAASFPAASGAVVATHWDSYNNDF